MRGSLRRVLGTSFAVGGLALALSVPAVAIDVNKDGWHDFLLREQPYLPYANVGANCDAFQINGRWYGRLNIRPPRVWGLPALGVQRVAWRTRFWELTTGQVVWRNNWEYATVRPRRATDFNGGPDAPRVMIASDQYWLGSQWYQHPQSDGARIRATVDVGWWNARKRRWIIRSLRVVWQFSTYGRTTGIGQTTTASTPVTRWVC